MHEPSQFSACFPMTDGQTDRVILFFCKNIALGGAGLSKRANVACLRHYVRAFCVCLWASVRLLARARPVLRVERRQITRQGGRSCKAMLNTSLPLEQLPHPPQLYAGWGGPSWQRSGFQPFQDSCPGFFGTGRWRKGAGPWRRSRDPQGLL